LLNIHEQGIMIVHVFWERWLIAMGMLTYKSGNLAKIIGILLVKFYYLLHYYGFYLKRARKLKYMNGNQLVILIVITLLNS